MRYPAKFLPATATAFVLVLFYVTGILAFDRFGSWRVLTNLLGDNAFTGVAAVGATFVILSGGIDLSVGAVMAAVSTLIAVLVEKKGMRPEAAIPFAVALATAFGAAMGALIHAYRLPPFLVTLAGMFFARAAGFLFAPESLAIRHPGFASLGDFSFDLDRGATIGPLVMLWFAVSLAAIVLLAKTRFGRRVYAVGGDAESALFLGVPVGRTTVAVYAIGGFASGLAGAAYAFYMKSGNPAACVGLELDVIAAVVIGGTLLTGGRGYVLGTFLGVLVLGLVQTLITFHGKLNSWWTRIVIGLLVLLFIGAQRAVAAAAERRSRRAAGGTQ